MWSEREISASTTQNRWLAIEDLVDLRACLRISAKKMLFAVVGGVGLFAWIFKRNGED